jgi:FtsZ-binding cell division protein ZapB
MSNQPIGDEVQSLQYQKYLHEKVLAKMEAKVGQLESSLALATTEKELFFEKLQNLQQEVDSLRGQVQNVSEDREVENVEPKE